MYVVNKHTRKKPAPAVTFIFGFVDYLLFFLLFGMAAALLLSSRTIFCCCSYGTSRGGGGDIENTAVAII